MGWGTQPLRIQLRLLTFQFRVSRILVRHVVPLGLNATQLATRYRLWGRGFLAQRVGEPNPYAYSFGCSRSNFRASRILVGHVVPLGLNAAEFAARYRLWGRGFLAQRVGEPNPYGYSFGCSRSNFRASRILVRHVAPLGLNATQLATRYRLWGRGFLAQRVGNPTPTDAASVAHVPISCLPYPGATCRPSGAKCLTFPFSLSCFSLLRALLRLCGESYHVSRLTVSFPLKLRLPLLHERLPALLIILAGETGIHQLLAKLQIPVSRVFADLRDNLFARFDGQGLRCPRWSPCIRPQNCPVPPSALPG